MTTTIPRGRPPFRIDPHHAVWYVIAQITGALMGAVAVRYIIPAGTVQLPALSGPALISASRWNWCSPSCCARWSSTSRRATTTPTNSYFGIAIGFTILAGAVAVGGISGAAFNPAVVIGGIAMGLFAWPALCLFVAAQAIAGIAAGAAFRALNPNDK